MAENITPFYVIYCSFMSKITDDLYADAWTEADTFRYMEDILIEAIPKFRYPKFRIKMFDRTVVTMEDEKGEPVSRGAFFDVLDNDEVEILAELMFIGWLNRQLATTNLTKMRYGSSDMKLTSQANHMDKLTKIIQYYVAENKRFQSLYGRRKVTEDGKIVPNFGALGKSAFEENTKRYPQIDWWSNPYWTRRSIDVRNQVQP